MRHLADVVAQIAPRPQVRPACSIRSACSSTGPRANGANVSARQHGCLSSSLILAGVVLYYESHASGADVVPLATGLTASALGAIALAIHVSVKPVRTDSSPDVAQGQTFRDPYESQGNKSLRTSSLARGITRRSGWCLHHRGVIATPRRVPASCERISSIIGRRVYLCTVSMAGVQSPWPSQTESESRTRAQTLRHPTAVARPSRLIARRRPAEQRRRVIRRRRIIFGTMAALIVLFSTWDLVCELHAQADEHDLH